MEFQNKFWDLSDIYYLYSASKTPNNFKLFIKGSIPSLSLLYLSWRIAA